MMNNVGKREIERESKKERKTEREIDKNMVVFESKRK